MRKTNIHTKVTSLPINMCVGNNKKLLRGTVEFKGSQNSNTITL